MNLVSAGRREGAACFGAAILGVLLTGCPPQQNSKSLPQPPATRSADSPWQDGAAFRRLRNLEREANNLADDSKKLPGRDAAEHSRLMQRVFTDLLQTLPLLQDPANDRVFAQRLTIIQTSRAQLAAGSGDLAVEPAIDTALRAAAFALANVSHEDGFEQADVGAVLDKLSARVDRLDLERDPNLHRVDVAQVVDLISQTVSKLAAALSGQLTAGGNGAAHPPSVPDVAAPPATAPTTAPSVTAPPPAAPEPGK